MTDEKGQLVRVTIPMTGMTCASCVRRDEQALAKKEGVAEASVNVAAEKTSVVYDSAVMNLDELIVAKRDAGYTVAAA